MTDSTLTGAWPSYSAEEIDAVRSVLESGKVNYHTGTEGRNFEREYAGHCGSKYAIALANGSVSLDLALEAAGIGFGDDVIVTPRSFIASASCAVRVGARPVFADIDRDSQNITAATIEAALTSNTKAIVAVHHAGWPCDMDPIMSLAEKHGILVIEDCAQAHGAKYKGRPVGGIGHVGSFSFCQDKIMTTGGEGGMLVTSDEQLWRRAWAIKDHGKSYEAVYRDDHPIGFRWLHESIGTNWRMTEMQAAIGRVQLTKLSKWNAQREGNALALADVLNRFAFVRVPMSTSVCERAFYRLYAIIDTDGMRNAWSLQRLLQEFADRKIPVGTGSCAEIYREKAMQDRGFEPVNRLPVAASLEGRSLAFVVHPTLTDADMERYCAVIEEVMRAASVK